MKYPKFLKENDTIALIATSLGSNHDPYRTRLKVAIDKLSLKFNIKKGHRLFRNKEAVSSPHDKRAKEFNLLYKNKKVDFIYSIAGGQIMMGMLPYVDFEKIKKLTPKYFCGFSDNTNLTFTLTTICDVATIYGNSPSSFAYDNLNVDAIDTLDLLLGKKLKFDSYPKYHGINSRIETDNPLENLVYNDENYIKSLRNDKEEFEGRIIGGCIDVLVCLCGTKFDNVKNFIEKYKDDGIIWYFDPCDFNSCGLYRALLQLELAGWFKYVKGFVVGRNANSLELFDYTFKQAIEDVLAKYDVPVLYEADISHVRPDMPVINGAIAKVNYQDGKYSIEYFLR